MSSEMCAPIWHDVGTYSHYEFSVFSFFVLTYTAFSIKRIRPLLH